MKLRFKWLPLGLTSALLLTACGTANTDTVESVATNSEGESNLTGIDDTKLDTTIVEKYSTSTFTGNEAPPLLPPSEGEAPISALCTNGDKYPDPLRAEIGLWDRTDDIWYNLDDVFPDNFVINREHLYTARLWLHSDGDTIKNIRVEAQLPNTESNPHDNCIRFVASDNENGQVLLTARLYLETDDGEDFEIHPYINEDGLNHGGILIGNINNEATSIGFEFSVSHLE